MENAQRDSELQFKAIITCALGMENELLPSSCSSLLYILENQTVTH